MNDRVDIFKIKEARRRLLFGLNVLYESPITLRSLYNSFCSINYDKGLFAKDITYFYDKGWIEFIDDKIGGADKFMDKVIKLTAEGKEIAEGTQTDPALEI
jgi:hypothetical protein